MEDIVIVVSLLIYVMDLIMQMQMQYLFLAVDRILSNRKSIALPGIAQ